MMKLFTNAMGSMAVRMGQLVARGWARLQTMKLQPQRWVPIAFVGLLLLTTSVNSANLNQSTKDALNNLISKGENGRPVTAGQWQSENKALQGQPAKQAKRIAKETADAVGEMGEIYPGNVKELTPGLENRSLERDD